MRTIAWGGCLFAMGCGVNVSATGESDGARIHVEVRTNGTKVFVGPKVANPNSAGKAKFDIESWKAGDVVFEVAAEDQTGDRATTQLTVKHDPKKYAELVDCAPGDATFGFRLQAPNGVVPCAATADGSIGVNLHVPSDATVTIAGQAAGVDADGNATARVPLWPFLAAHPTPDNGPWPVDDAPLAAVFPIHVERPGKPASDLELTADLGGVVFPLLTATWTEMAAGKLAPPAFAGKGVAWHHVWRVTGKDNVTRTQSEWQVFGAKTVAEVARVVKVDESARSGAICGKYQLGSGKEVEPRLQLVDWTLTLVPGSAAPKAFSATGGCPTEMFLDKEKPETVERFPAPEPIASWLARLE